jgi:hypothetical protein
MAARWLSAGVQGGGMSNLGGGDAKSPKAAAATAPADPPVTSEALQALAIGGGKAKVLAEAAAAALVTLQGLDAVRLRAAAMHNAGAMHPA